MTHNRLIYRIFDNNNLKDVKKFASFCNIISFVCIIQVKLGVSEIMPHLKKISSQETEISSHGTGISLQEIFFPYHNIGAEIYYKTAKT